MQLLLGLIGVVVLVVLGLTALALTWANTPHGRIKPIFALAFGLTRLRGGRQAAGVIDAGSMTDAAKTRAIREEFTRSTAMLSKPVSFDGTVEERMLDGPGGLLPVRIYKPAGSGPFPLLVYYHGGGFVVGNPDYTDAVTRGIAQQSPAVVVSVDYRMAPEAPFPAAVEDVCFATEWCFENAASLGARPGPVAVGGDSAGGNLAAVVAQEDVRAGRNQVGLQLLIYPTVDIIRRDRRSQVAFESGYGLSMRDVAECMDRYVPQDIPRDDPRVSPLFAASVEGTARAVVFTAGFDLLCDEGTEYAERLAKEGVEVRHIHQPAVPHGYIQMTRICREATDAIALMAGEVAGLLRSGAGSRARIAI
jgi:acetyl esterase